MDELIKALRYCGNFEDRDGCDEECPYFNDKDCPKRIMHDAADAIEQLEAQITKWISVEDRLPGAYENVLVCENDDVLLAYWNGHEWVQCDLYECVTLYPTYWMELPKPPSAEMKREYDELVSAPPHIPPKEKIEDMRSELEHWEGMRGEHDGES
jgi:hypothetical protein